MLASSSRSLLWSRLIHPLRRHRLAYWAVAITLVVATGFTVASTTARAERARDAYGSTVAVLVTRTDLAAGALIEPDDVTLTELPSALVPEGPAVAAVGRRASAALVTGEVVLESRLAPANRSAVAARLPAGTRGVAVPVRAAAPPTEVGDRVDVLASLDPVSYPDRPGTRVVSTGVAVVSVDDDATTVAVPLDDLSTVVDALNNGRVTLVLSGA